MDLSRVLEQLRRELSHLDAAILSLERVQQNSARRGRPPKLVTELRQNAALSELDAQADSPDLATP